MSHNGLLLPRALPFGAFITRMEQVTQNTASDGVNVLRVWLSTGETQDVRFKNGAGYDIISVTADDGAGVPRADYEVTQETAADGRAVNHLNIAFKNLCGSLVSVGQTTTLDNGEEATVTEDAASTARNKILNFGIPRGVQGVQGPPGMDGAGVYRVSKNLTVVGDYIRIIHWESTDTQDDVYNAFVQGYVDAAHPLPQQCTTTSYYKGSSGFHIIIYWGYNITSSYVQDGRCDLWQKTLGGQVGIDNAWGDTVVTKGSQSAMGRAGCWMTWSDAPYTGSHGDGAGDSD